MPKKLARRIGSKRTNGWKDVQSNKQSVKTTRLAILTIAAILSILILSKIVRFTITAFHPWGETSIKRSYLWDNSFNLNLVIKAKKVSLVSFNPKMGKITIIDVPDQTYLDVSHGFGNWQISSIYGLGESQKNLGGGRLLKDTVKTLFGIPIDGILQLSGKYSEKETKDIISEMRASPFAILGIFPHLKSDLTPFELIKINMGFSSVRFDKVKNIDLQALDDFLQKSKLMDGTLVYIPDTVKLDSLMSDLADETIKNDHQSIAIFNSTDHPGLAQKAARLISNMGGDVIITANSQNKLKKSQILGEKSKTLTRVKQIFNPDDIIDPILKDLASSRAQINIFLGEDYFE